MHYKIPDWPQLRAKADLVKAERPSDAFMAKVLEGALQAGESQNPIRGNLCASALREVTGHVLHALAPDERVSRCSWYKQEPNTRGPTRAQRAMYIVQGGLEPKLVADVLHLDPEDVSRPLVEAIGQLNRATHVREDTVLDDDEDIRALADDALGSLLDLFNAARGCQRDLRQHLENEIRDAVFDKFLSETLQELDELSTHTMFEGHELEQFEVVSLDDEFVVFDASGIVYVELQYGSNSDLRRGEGAVMSDSYPYTAGMKAPVKDPYAIIRDSVTVTVDNSGFYE